MLHINLIILLLISSYEVYNGRVTGSPLPISNKMSDPSMDSKFSATFSIGDLIDDIGSMMPAFNDSEAELDEVYNDIPASPLDPEDFFLAADPEYDMLKTPLAEDGNDPITRGHNFEGDIKNVDISEIRALYDSAVNDELWMRNAIKDEWRKWPGGVVPYVISSRYSRYERSIIAKAMQEYKTKTCIR